MKGRSVIYFPKVGSKVEVIDKCGFYRIITITGLNGDSFVGRMRCGFPNKFSGKFSDITRIINS
tara:strand:+ start:776 stop:967 length:192 start_codon:yes stop_codon:yes gene_type:complete